MNSIQFTDKDRDARGFIRITPPERTLADLLPATPLPEAAREQRTGVPWRAQIAGAVVLILAVVFIVAAFLGAHSEPVSAPAAPTAFVPLPTAIPTSIPTAMPTSEPVIVATVPPAPTPVPPTPEPIIIYQEAPPAPTQCATVSGGGITVQRCGSASIDQLDADARQEWNTQFGVTPTK
jgi:hypothetical protein